MLGSWRAAAVALRIEAGLDTRTPTAGGLVTGAVDVELFDPLVGVSLSACFRAGDARRLLMCVQDWSLPMTSWP